MSVVDTSGGFFNFTIMKQVTINLYAFDELNDKAKQKAIDEHCAFLDSQPEEYENEEGKMVEEYVDHSEEDTIESIQINDYIFFEDGEMAHCTTYVEKHPKAGTTELKFHGRIYDITN